MAPDPGPTALYRLYGDFDVLLYVGVSKHPDYRLKEHLAVQPWDFLIRSRSVVWLDTRRAALDCERAAIETEAPLFNIALAQHDYQRWHAALKWMWNSGWYLTPWRLPALARLVAVEPAFWDVMVTLFNLTEQGNLGPVECGDCLWDRRFKKQVRAMFGYDAENELAKSSQLYEIATTIVGAALPKSVCDFHAGAEKFWDEDVA